MTRFLLLAALFCAVAVSTCVLALGVLRRADTVPAAVVPAAPVPVVEWRDLEHSAVVIPPAGVYRVVLIGREHSSETVGVRVSIRAAQPVSFALVPVRALDTGVTHPRELQTAPCAASSVLEVQRECNVSEALGPWALIVSDDRDTSAGAQIVALAAGYAGVTEPAATLTAQNRVSAAVSMRACWAHCAGDAGQQQQKQ